MSSVIISGDTSGAITLAAPAVAGTNTITLPATTGTVALTASPTFTGQATIPTINLTGGQIAFPSTQNPSADPNTLDDYEEGTWTPTGVGQTFTSASGKYTKIGRLVCISFDLVWSTNGAGNQAGFSGFPFAGNGQVFAFTRALSTYSGTMNISTPGYAGTLSGTLLWNNGNPGISDSAMSAATLSGSGFYFV